MDTIDLDAIIESHFTAYNREYAKIKNSPDRDIKEAMIEAINQALILANNAMDQYLSLLEKQSFEGWSEDAINGYKTLLITIKNKGHILHVNKLIKNG